jgi:hypothetical protein
MSKEQTPITGYGVYSVDNKTGRMELAQGDLFVRKRYAKRWCRENIRRGESLIILKTQQMMSKEQTPKEYRNNIHYWNETMSKEQTPIEVRALEFCEKHAHKLNAVDSYNLRSMLVDFANSEVLEALERERKNQPFSCWYCNAELKQK